MEKILSLFKQERTRVVVAAPLSKLSAYREWWAAAFAVALCLLSGSNLGAALLAAQAWSVGKTKALELFLRAVVYLAFSLMFGPQIALVLLILDSQAETSPGSTSSSSSPSSQTTDANRSKTVGGFVAFYRELGISKATEFLQQLAVDQFLIQTGTESSNSKGE